MCCKSQKKRLTLLFVCTLEGQQSIELSTQGKPGPSIRVAHSCHVCLCNCAKKSISMWACTGTKTLVGKMFAYSGEK